MPESLSTTVSGLTGDGHAAAPVDLRQLTVIVNPTARRVRGGGFDPALERLRKIANVTVLETAQRGDAEAMTRAALAMAPDAIVAAGGDGTINEIINGMAASSVPLGILPLGTANVLAAEIGLPTNPVKAADVILSGKTRPIHLGNCNGRLFAMMAGIGFDARVVQAVSPSLKRRLGKTAYVIESLAELGRHRPTEYRVSIDGGAAQTAGTVIIANGHYYGGRFIVAPSARLDSADLYACLFEHGSRVDALGYSAAMVLGALRFLSSVSRQPARIIRVEGPAGEPVQADGDIIGYLPIEVRVAASTLTIIAP
jgi:YegS/Rv2252/BmrU family lipid kinase